MGQNPRLEHHFENLKKAFLEAQPQAIRVRCFNGHVLRRSTPTTLAALCAGKTSHADPT